VCGSTNGHQEVKGRLYATNLTAQCLSCQTSGNCSTYSFVFYREAGVMGYMRTDARLGSHDLSKAGNCVGQMALRGTVTWS
jgi:hypothetical protein